MAQPPMPQNITPKPITLTILPQATTVPSTTTNRSAVTPGIPMPDFNHTPIYPTTIHLPVAQTTPPNNITCIPQPAFVVNQRRKDAVTVVNETEEEKLERQRQANREYQKRFRDKTKGFTELAGLPSINERIKHVWLLTYPDIYQNIDPRTMDSIIAQSINSMFASFNK